MKLKVAQISNASKVYKSADGETTALYPTSLDVYDHELTLIIGPSGSGKTTLLSLLGCVIYPTEGKVFIGDKLVNDLNAKELAKLRLEKIGFIFQSMNLIAPLNAYENVALPLQLLHTPKNEIKARTEAAIDKVGMSDRLKHKPKMMSGGQQQRIAIARALVTKPVLLLCDEPTASLDENSLYKVMEELRTLANEGKAVCVVTHDPRLMKYADRVVKVENGKIASDTYTNEETKINDIH